MNPIVIKALLGSICDHMFNLEQTIKKIMEKPCNKFNEFEFGYNLGHICICLRILTSNGYPVPFYLGLEHLQSYSTHNAYWTMCTPPMVLKNSLIEYGFAIANVKFRFDPNVSTHYYWISEIFEAVDRDDYASIKTIFLKKYSQFDPVVLPRSSIRFVFPPNEKICWAKILSDVKRENLRIHSWGGGLLSQLGP